jgi:hypothetical protein
MVVKIFGRLRFDKSEQPENVLPPIFLRDSGRLRSTNRQQLQKALQVESERLSSTDPEQPRNVVLPSLRESPAESAFQPKISRRKNHWHKSM